jgi:hypothetical protein
MANNTNIDLEFTEAGFNLAEWRESLKSGDIAFVYSRTSAGPVVILKWLEEYPMFGATEKNHVYGIFRNGKRYVARKCLYPRRPKSAWVPDEMIIEG